MEVSSVPLSGGLEGDNQNPYAEVGAQLHNAIGGSQQEPRSFYIEEPLSLPLLLKASSTEDGWGKTNHLGRTVDLGILSQSNKSWGIWLDIERDL
jgi:hypothetical protein